MACEEGNFSGKTFSWFKGSVVAPEPPVGSQELRGVEGAQETGWGIAWASFARLLTGKAHAAHISPDATDAEPSLPLRTQETLVYSGDSNFWTCAVLPLVSGSLSPS